MNWWAWLVGALSSMAAIYAVFLAVLFIRRPDGTSVTDLMRLLPDVVRLLHRLATDRSLPRGIRVRIWLLLGYLAMPIDLVPDFLPVIGYADDVVVTAMMLRTIVRRAGSEPLRRHWPGTDEGLAMLAERLRVRL
jgi:uncharacterized membrane protein YkvA (DUF1232 family)